MSWLRDDAKAIAEGLPDGHPYADDVMAVTAVMLSVIDTDHDQEMTLSDDFTVRRAEEIADREDIDGDELYSTVDNLMRNLHGHRILIRADDDFPEGLYRMEHPPFILYARGELDWIAPKRPLVAIVGSRSITAAQEDTIRDIALAAGDIISGLAPGTDDVAMWTALDNAAGVVGVLGCGTNHPFGPHDLQLAQRIEKEGLLLSEYPLGTEPHKDRLLRRNEIIAALSDTFIACAAQFKGGTFSGLRRAQKMGVPILAVPGTEALDAWLEEHPERAVDDDLIEKLGEDYEDRWGTD